MRAVKKERKEGIPVIGGIEGGGAWQSTRPGSRTKIPKQRPPSPMDEITACAGSVHNLCGRLWAGKCRTGSEENTCTLPLVWVILSSSKITNPLGSKMVPAVFPIEKAIHSRNLTYRMTLVDL